MSNVTLDIAGRSYTVACEDGQEPHIRRLGQMIDAKLADLGAAARQNEPRSLLFAALLMADEVHELRNAAAAPAPPPAAPEEPPTAPLLEALAEQLEKLAESLEARAHAS